MDQLDCFIGKFSLSQLKTLHIDSQIAYFLLVDNNLTLGIAIYQFQVFICDPLGKLTDIPRDLSIFLYNSCYTHIYITSKICDSCLSTIQLFFTILSETHCYKIFLSYFSENYSLNEHIIRTCLERRGIVVDDKSES